MDIPKDEEKVLSVTGEQAHAAVMEFMASRRSLWGNPFADIPVDPDPKYFYIFNVGPFSFHRLCGSWGNFHIPACEEYGSIICAHRVPSIFRESGFNQEGELVLSEIDGEAVAKGIVHPPFSRGLAGVFYSENESPGQETLLRNRESACEEAYEYLWHLKNVNLNFNLSSKSRRDELRILDYFESHIKKFIVGSTR